MHSESVEETDGHILYQKHKILHVTIKVKQYDSLSVRSWSPLLVSQEFWLERFPRLVWNAVTNFAYS